MAKFLIDATSFEFVEGVEQADFTNHTHKAADITSGVFPLERGGTGGTTAQYARDNLDVYSKDEVYTKDEVDAAIANVDIDLKDHLAIFEIDINSSGTLAAYDTAYIQFGSAGIVLNDYAAINVVANYFYPNADSSNPHSFPIVSVNGGGAYVSNPYNLAYPYNHCKIFVFAIKQTDVGGDV